MENFISLSVPNLEGNELKYITEAVHTEWVSTGGPFIESFEQKISSYLQIDCAVACQSGTVGLHLAMMVSGVTEDNEVIVPTATFIATVNPLSYIGAEPIFMDCDENLLLDLDKLEDFIDIKRKNYLLYKNRIENIDGIALLEFNNQIRPNYWFYSVIVNTVKFGGNRLLA